MNAAGLPTDDLGQPCRSFFALVDAQGLIGFVGIERGSDYRANRATQRARKDGVFRCWR